MLLLAASGLLEAGEEEAALETAIQAKRVAAQAPDLLPVQRSQTFESLRPISRRFNDSFFSQQIDELARNPFLQPSGVLLTPRWLSLGAALPVDEAVVAAAEQRRLAARVLADRLSLTGGIDVDPERQTLAAALVAEDQIRGDSYRTLLGAGLSLAQQLTLLHERRAWLALKSRIASGGFGMTLVPEWEANAAFLRDDLATATASLNPLLDSFITSLAEPAEQAALRVDGLHWFALQAELGLYPGASITDLSDRIHYAQSELERLGQPLALPAEYEPSASPPGFRIQER
jgi:hypothetical protein